ncbi:MAG: histidinol-phosphate transaminase [Gammaproteobacteria bacterium]
MSIERRIERYAAPWVRELVPYKVEDAGGLLKLDAMENPYGLPEELAEPWLRTIGQVALNRYPDPMASALRRKLLDQQGLPATFGVVLGNGSDELIHMICLAFARREGACVVCPEPSFAVYHIAAQAVGMTYVGVPLMPADFSLDLDAMLAAVRRREPAVIFLASPNNPTANRLDSEALEVLCAATPGLVVLDEAYYRFAGGSRIAALEMFENLVVMQTLSKIGLAGLRVGALFGAQPWLDLLERVRMPYNINVLSQAGALFALEHEAAFQRQIDAIVAARAELAAGLAAIPGIRSWPSATNFILLRTAAGQGTTTFAALKQRGILIKNLDGGHPLLADCLRVTVGTPAENNRFLQALEEIGAR